MINGMMKKQELPERIKVKAGRVLEVLGKKYPEPKTLLVAVTPWQLLVATVLAAQCTDARVNMVTPALFSRWPGPGEMAGASLEELEECIKSTGLYKSKAKHLLATANRVVNVFGGNVPDNMKDLVTLPGVARKTANVVLWGAFGKNEGVAVDTHVGRIAYRIGLTSSREQGKAEKELMRIFPREEWGDLNHRLVWYGRDVCRSRSPLCAECGLSDICDRRDV